MSKNMIRGMFAALLLAVFGSASAAPMTYTGPDSGSFWWDGGLGDTIRFGSYGIGDIDSIEITVGSDSVLSSFGVDDCCVVGDKFGLLVDGVLTAWTTEAGGSAGMLYSASITDLFLSAGTHYLSLVVTGDCCGAGAGSWSIGSVTAAVPEPATLAMLGLGLLSVGFARRRKA